MENTALKILAAKAPIQRLFYKYGIDEDVTVHTVQLALQELPEAFEHDLEKVLQNTAHNTGETTNTATKGDKALEWVTGLGSLGLGVFQTAKNQQPAPSNGAVNIYTPPPTAQPKENSSQKIIIAIVVVILLAAVAFFVMKKK